MRRQILPDPDTAEDAFWTSINQLKSDDLGRKGWLRAQAVTGIKEATLKNAALGRAPISLQAAEAIDLANVLAGGPATNADAMAARRAKVLEGIPGHGPDPGRYVQRANDDLHEAIRAIQFGKGDQSELRRLYRELTKLHGNLLEAISVREEQSAQDRGRRNGEDGGQGARPLPRLVRATAGS